MKRPSGPYAKLSALAEGSVVIVDGDFTCMKPWSKHVVKNEADRKDTSDYLYIRCNKGTHRLIGQLADDDDTLIGVFHA